MQAAHNEIEIKLAVSDLPSLRRRLKKIRARSVSKRVLEQNTLYDTPDGGLARHGQLLRIRTESQARKSGATSPLAKGKKRSRELRALLTYKGPIFESNEEGMTIARRFKVREEHEVEIADANSMRQLLEALGMRPIFRYEKYRTTFLLPRLAGVQIEVDETPVGTFLEVEGDPSGIEHAAKLLGYREKDYIRQSYGALYIRECRRRGLIPSDMLFSPKKSSK